MKQSVIVAALCTLGSSVNADEKWPKTISFDAGQALLSGMLIDSTLLTFSYEKPLTYTLQKHRSVRFSLYTGSLCTNNCWDYVAIGAGMRTYSGSHTNSRYFSYDVIAGSHERDGFVVGANVGLGFTTMAGKDLIADPYIKVGTGGVTLGMNLGMKF
ncbi:MAG: hypothetical protein OEX12_01555 [Gammaproteobacteria bacterium]|nr:hypothetical protein [Gammaproteobacteria bacterium]